MNLPRWCSTGKCDWSLRLGTDGFPSMQLSFSPIGDVNLAGTNLKLEQIQLVKTWQMQGIQPSGLPATQYTGQTSQRQATAPSDQYLTRRTPI